MTDGNEVQRLASLIGRAVESAKKKAANTAEKGTILGSLVCVSGQWMPYKIFTDILVADGQTVLCLVNSSRTAAYIVGR